MHKAYVFQHKYTGVQIFVYHSIGELDARDQFRSIVINDKDWICLGKKVATDVPK